MFYNEFINVYKSIYYILGGYRRHHVYDKCVVTP